MQELSPACFDVLSPVQFEIQKTIEWDTYQHINMRRLKYAAKLGIPHLPQLEPHTGVCAIVGAGPSVRGFAEQIASIRAAHEFNTIMAINAAHNWLISQGVIPRIQVIFEEDLEDVETALGGPPHPDVYYYVCSSCNEHILQQLEGYHRVLWHAFLPPQRYQQAIAKIYPGEFMVAGGYATFFRTLTIAIILGYRDFDIFGCDSSFEENSHVDGYAMANIEPHVKVWGTDLQGGVRPFTTQGGLAFQAVEFMKFCSVNQVGLKLRVHGDGLLRYVHQARYPEQYQEMKG